MDARALLDRVVNLNLALTDLPTRDRLDVLQIAWLCIAATARTEALIVPGGFPDEQARQVERLRKMMALVSAAEPDLEMESAFHEEGIAGVARHLQRVIEIAEGDDK